MLEANTIGWLVSDSQTSTILAKIADSKISSHFLGEMDADLVMDHGLGELLWLGCAGRHRWFAGQPAGSWSDLLDAPRMCRVSDLGLQHLTTAPDLCGRTMASIPNLRRVQYRRIPYQRPDEQCIALLQQSCL